MKPRILAIDDDVDWLENFKAWVPEEIAVQDSAATTSGAVELLRKYHYHVVLLDLSMDPHNPSNRENRAIQEYLATKPEGTLYIVISSVAQKDDARDSAFYLGARDFIFKTEIEPALLRDKVTRYIEEASKYDEQFVADARRKLVRDFYYEDRIRGVLDPKKGAGGMYPMMDTLFSKIAPIAAHKNRQHFDIWNGCVLGLVWSRKLGKAISIALANNNMPVEEEIKHLADWLGYAHPGQPMLNQDSHKVRILLFEEPSVLDEHFDLPVISLPGA